MKTDGSAEELRSFYLPDFCTSRATLAIVLIVELTALVTTLARGDVAIGFWTDLARTSIFLLWIGLVGAGLLCWSRKRLMKVDTARASTLVLAGSIALIATVSAGIWTLGQTDFAADTGIALLVPQHMGSFVLRNAAMGFIVTALALRYFYVTHQWRRNVEMQARARVHALQARIRPHFLFNSMNTIASLTRTDPARAESAVQDLADLFRANLSEKRNTITLAEELEVAQIYQRIEQIRLGDRLKVDWNISQLPMQALVPGLLLQPLLENAIYHGIEPRPQGGTVTVNGELGSGLVTVVVRNPIPERHVERDGNRLAMSNIRERLSLMYGDRALVKAGRFDAEYIVTLRFPHVESLDRLTT
jgi:two-component system, LytTR family, sensor histidine kinase AlgZ